MVEINNDLLGRVAKFIDDLAETTTIFPGMNPSTQNDLIVGITNILKAFCKITGNYKEA